MGAVTAVLALVVLVLGGLVGWHAKRAHGAHGDLKTTRGRVPGFKQTRLRSGAFSIALLLVALFVIKDLIGH
jgi:hypothetical protein